MLRYPVRDLRCGRRIPPRFCDVVIDGEAVYLERKERDRYDRISWEDMQYQVRAALKEAEEEGNYRH